MKSALLINVKGSSLQQKINLTEFRNLRDCRPGMNHETHDINSVYRKDEILPPHTIFESQLS